jgi:hypothetical protein
MSMVVCRRISCQLARILGVPGWISDQYSISFLLVKPKSVVDDSLHIISSFEFVKRF